MLPTKTCTFTTQAGCPLHKECMHLAALIYGGNTEACNDTCIFPKVTASVCTVISAFLRSPIKPEELGLKLKVVLKWRCVYVENIRVVPLMPGLKIEGSFKCRGV